MSKNEPDISDHVRWSLFRYSVVGRLLASPPPQGKLQGEIQKLAEQQWEHPITREPTQFGFATLERWYYAARQSPADPVGALLKKSRSDAGRQPSLGGKVREKLLAQYKGHRSWSYQLHYDNLVALVQEDPAIGSVPSYATVRRFMKANGLRKAKRRRRHSEVADRTQDRLDAREVRSYEKEHVGALWHWDFHEGSLPVITPRGEWAKPWLFAAMDDYSRVVAHAQWYLTENAENCVHGLIQGILKYGRPCAAMSDNGGAETAAETTQGLGRLSIEHETILPYAPHQNAKQETWWAQVEGRLLPMLENVEDLTLDVLNPATQSWVEMEHNRGEHEELGQTPLERYASGPRVMRPSPSLEELRIAFGMQVSRKQRRSDGTISIEGRRFEIPNRYRHFERVTVRYARWDLTFVHMADPRTDKVLCRIYPLDKASNADGRRRVLDPSNALLDQSPASPGMAPLLRQLMADHAATGLPPAYVPKDELDDSDPDPDQEIDPS